MHICLIQEFRLLPPWLADFILKGQAVLTAKAQVEAGRSQDQAPGETQRQLPAISLAPVGWAPEMKKLGPYLTTLRLPLPIRQGQTNSFILGP